MTNSLRLTLITPEQQVLEVDADSVVIPAHDGEIGILPKRAPLMCELGIGQLRYTSGAQGERVFVDGGFAQVVNDVVTVLTPRALKRGQVTPAVLAEARAAAERAPTPGEEPTERSKSRQRQLAMERVAGA